MARGGKKIGEKRAEVESLMCVDEREVLALENRGLGLGGSLICEKKKSKSRQGPLRSARIFREVS